MLVLTRRINEQITIGNQTIKITVLDVKGGRVRIGIEAPGDVRICRQEVLLDDDQLRLDMATCS